MICLLWHVKSKRIETHNLNCELEMVSLLNLSPPSVNSVQITCGSADLTKSVRGLNGCGEVNASLTSASRGTRERVDLSAVIDIIPNRFIVFSSSAVLLDGVFDMPIYGDPEWDSFDSRTRFKSLLTIQVYGPGPWKYGSSVTVRAASSAWSNLRRPTLYQIISIPTKCLCLEGYPFLGIIVDIHEPKKC